MRSWLRAVLKVVIMAARCRVVFQFPCTTICSGEIKGKENGIFERTG